MRARSPLLPGLALTLLIAFAAASALSTGHARHPDLIQNTGVDACPRVGEAPMPVACVPQVTVPKSRP